MKYRKVIMYFIVLYGKTKKCQIHQTMTCVNNQLFLGAIYLCLLHALVDIIETATLIKLIDKDLLLGFLVLHVLLVPEKIRAECNDTVSIRHFSLSGRDLYAL